MINLTESAAKEIGRVISENGLPDGTALRLGVKGGGCAGFGYLFDFAENPGDLDEVYESMGVRIFVDRKSLLYIDGTEVDFTTGLTDRGFKFANPKADTSCGCGTSFTPKQPSFS